LHCDALGIRQHANASSLVTLIEDGCFGLMEPRGPWDERLNIVLTRVFTERNAWAAQHHEELTQPRFKALTCSMSKRNDFPCLKPKGHNPIVISKWFLSKAENAVDVARPETIQRHCLLWGLCELWRIPHDIRPRFVFLK
jgi:hypothetical protein